MFDETDILLPLLQAPNPEELLKQEALNNALLRINAETSRKRAIGEVVRRYRAMPPAFWAHYRTMPFDDRRVACFFVILKTYKILFDFHVHVTLRKWNSIARSVTIDDIMLEFNEISAADAFVDSWTDATKKKVASAYLTILRRVGMLRPEGTLQPLVCGNFGYYVTLREQWFLEACLLQPYQIETIKTQLA